MSCQGAGPAAELGVVLVAAIFRLHDQFAVSKVRVVHTGVLHLQVLHADVHPVLGLVIAVAGPADVAPSVLRPGSVNGEGVVEQNSHPGVAVQRSSVLQPGDARPQPAVDVAGNPDV